MSRVIIVSNRLPVTVSFRKGQVSLQSSPGGLATGLGSVHRPEEGLWLGWPGVAAEELSEENRRSLGQTLRARGYVPVHLSRREVDGYYSGFSNATLWPILHYFPTYAEYDRQTWESYVRANQAFREAVRAVYRPGDLIWVHDYHLMLLPALLRQDLPGARIGFFLHTPFPHYEVLRLLPWHREIVEGLLGADLIGFHTDAYGSHFLEAVRAVTGLEVRLGRLQSGGRPVTVDTFPMGIDFERFEAAARDPEVLAEADRVRRTFAGSKVILSVDRLDYSKGIPQRLLAFQELLEEAPELREKVHLLLYAVPSRVDVDRYAELTRTVERLVSETNGRFATLSWVPVRYFYRSLPFRSLVARYAVADVMLVTPLRDGMNLVAKEYVAASTDERGALVLSEMAGAAAELPEALLVNPNNTRAMAEALHTALTLPPEEQVRRMRPMRERLRRGNVAHWCASFLEALASVPPAVPEPVRARTGQRDLTGSFRRAARRVLVLDYDGTLVPFAGRPEEATPDEALLALLRRLAGKPGTRLVLASGRDRRTLDRWFGSLGVDLVAEHGAWYRPRGGHWRLFGNPDVRWKAMVRPFLERLVRTTPGAILEEKTLSLAWHYRLVDPELARRRLAELAKTLAVYGLPWRLGVLEGQKVLEVRDVRVHKGLVFLHWLKGWDPDFVLAAGDDETDEDLFTAAPSGAFTIKVGDGPTEAALRVAGPAALRELLEGLAAVARPVPKRVGPLTQAARTPGGLGRPSVAPPTEIAP